jgi:hypothetical protein
MRELTVNELSEVNGGEILVSPGQLGIAFTNNTIIVITGTIEATSLLSVGGAILTGWGIGWEIGSWINEQFNISGYLAEACWNYVHRN